ncbi:MAG: endonuclease NucS [Gammaproteobacteria bacterium]|nr:endonuclease NucS [Gammaproteobacteria bacterium]
MNEKQMEIIVSRGIDQVLGSGYELKAQQVGVGGGRLDLLVSRPDGAPMVVELKKGRLAKNHVGQVRRYADELSAEAQVNVTAMIIANVASPSMIDFEEKSGVCVKTISESRLSELGNKIGLSQSDLLGDRRKAGVLFGVRTGLRTTVPLHAALAECPKPIGRLVRSLGADSKHSRFSAGTSQIVLQYRGIKVGGLNRWERGGHTYVSTGVVLSVDHELALDQNRFFRTSRNSTGKHEHIWWERRWDGSDYACQSKNTFRFFFNVIDEALGPVLELGARRR